MGDEKDNTDDARALSLRKIRNAIDPVANDGKFFVGQAQSHRFVLLERSAAPFTTLTDAERAFENVLRAFPYIRTHWRLLIDLRQAPMRSDAAFERVVKRVEPELVRDFERHTILVGSAVGVLQVTRQAQQSNVQTFVTRSESAALTHLGYARTFTDPPKFSEPS